ncbi:hypothetical protein LguiB_025866 [Lonicera macranthoides]
MSRWWEEEEGCCCAGGKKNEDDAVHGGKVEENGDTALDFGHRVFIEMQTEILCLGIHLKLGYSQNGLYQEVTMLYERMILNTKLDSITLADVVPFHACKPSE